MFDWFSKTDPNTVIGIVALLGSFGTWLYHKIKGDKAASIKDQVTGILRQIVLLVSKDSSLSNDARNEINRILWSRLAAIGIPNTPTTQAIVSPLVEHALADLGHLLDTQSKNVAAAKGQLDDLEARTKAVLDAFTPPKYPLGLKP